MTNKDEEIYKLSAISDKNHIMQIELKSIEKYINLNSSYIEDYIKTTFIGNFSLDELSRESNYYKQFENGKKIIEEIKGYKGNEKINIKEEKEKIIIIFPIPSVTFKEIKFELKLEEKSDRQKLEEYEEAFKQFKDEIKLLKDGMKNLDERFLMSGFNSKIIDTKKDYEIIKMWISPFKKFKAKLLYSFYKKYKNFDGSYEFEDVENFHSKCDNKSSILLICQSKNEIFGGFTPLSFSNDNSYGYDDDSFLFSINKLRKYPKTSYNESCSIWKYEYYGPCFNYDLSFKKYYMNIISFEPSSYNIPDDFINESNSLINKDWIILNSLEIYELKENEL